MRKGEKERGAQASIRTAPKRAGFCSGGGDDRGRTNWNQPRRRRSKGGEQTDRVNGDPFLGGKRIWSTNFAKTRDGGRKGGFGEGREEAGGERGETSYAKVTKPSTQNTLLQDEEVGGATTEIAGKESRLCMESRTTNGGV